MLKPGTGWAISVSWSQPNQLAFTLLSPRMGVPRARPRCILIWCLMPLTMRHSTRAADPLADNTRYSVVADLIKDILNNLLCAGWLNEKRNTYYHMKPYYVILRNIMYIGRFSIEQKNQSDQSFGILCN